VHDSSVLDRIPNLNLVKGYLIGYGSFMSSSFGQNVSCHSVEVSRYNCRSIDKYYK